MRLPERVNSELRLDAANQLQSMTLELIPIFAPIEITI
jgi:hypothetical protein